MRSEIRLLRTLMASLWDSRQGAHRSPRHSSEAGQPQTAIGPGWVGKLPGAVPGPGSFMFRRPCQVK